MTKIVAVITNINVNNEKIAIILWYSTARERGMRTMRLVVSLEHSLIKIWRPCLSSKRLTSFGAKKLTPSQIVPISHIREKKSKIQSKIYALFVVRVLRNRIKIECIFNQIRHKKWPIATSAQKIIHFSFIFVIKVVTANPFPCV